MQQLVWSGASLFRRRCVFDFKPAWYNGSQHLSLILTAATDEALSQDPVYGSEGEDISFPDGADLILDSSYRIRTHVPLGDDAAKRTNMHEFKLLRGGETALRITNDDQVWGPLSESGNVSRQPIVLSNKLEEVDTSTGEAIFVWDSLSHVLPCESNFPPPEGWGSQDTEVIPWDYLSVRLPWPPLYGSPV